jgi:predicted MFS family arabinose efflux permease
MGASNVLWVDATTFAFSALVTLVAVPAVVTSASALRSTYFQGVKEGLRFLRRDHVLFALAISLFITNFLGNPLFAVVLPVYAKEELNSSGALGLLLSVVGIGALLGTMAFGWRLYRWRRRTVWLLAFVTAPLAYWSLIPKPALIVVAIVLFVSELAGGASNPLAVTIRHERIPAELRGRVFSTFSSISMASTPLGIALAGFSIENIGFTPTVLVLATTYQVVALGMLVVPAFHELDRTRADPHG